MSVGVHGALNNIRFLFLYIFSFFLSAHALPYAHVIYAPFAAQFFVAKLGFYRGVYYFLSLFLKHRLWVLVRTSSMFYATIWKISYFFYKELRTWILINGD